MLQHTSVDDRVVWPVHTATAQRARFEEYAQEPGQTAAETASWPRALWIGAGVGVVLTASVQWLVQEMLDIEATFISVLACGLVLWSLQSMRSSLETMRAVALAAVSAMLISLLISGSWQASGIALPLATWLAICSPATNDNWDHRSRFAVSADRLTKDSKLGLLIMLTALVAFWWQTWRPVNTSSTSSKAP